MRRPRVLTAAPPVAAVVLLACNAILGAGDLSVQADVADGATAPPSEAAAEADGAAPQPADGAVRRPGELDRTFGTDGFVTPPVTAPSQVVSLLVTPGDGVSLTGFMGLLLDELVHLTVSDTGGLNGAPVTADAPAARQWRAARPLEGGGFLGTGSNEVTAPALRPFVVTRYTAAGAVDLAFSSTDGGGTAFAALQEEANVFAGGRRNNASVMVRYHPDGGLRWQTVTPSNMAGGVDIVRSVLLRDDAVLAAGETIHADGKRVFLASYDAQTGAVRRTISLPCAAACSAPALLSAPDGTVLLTSGEAWSVRKLAIGTSIALVSGFGVAGEATPFAPGADEAVHAVALQADGKILLAGRRAVNGVRNMTVVRLDAQGALDRTFGDAGFADLGAGTASAIAVDGRGRIVVGGSLGTADVPRLTVARLLP